MAGNWSGPPRSPIILMASARIFESAPPAAFTRAGTPLGHPPASHQIEGQPLLVRVAAGEHLRHDRHRPPGRGRSRGPPVRPWRSRDRCRPAVGRNTGTAEASPNSVTVWIAAMRTGVLAALGRVEQGRHRPLVASHAQRLDHEDLAVGGQGLHRIGQNRRRLGAAHLLRRLHGGREQDVVLIAQLLLQQLLATRRLAGENRGPQGPAANLMRGIRACTTGRRSRSRPASCRRRERLGAAEEPFVDVEPALGRDLGQRLLQGPAAASALPILPRARAAAPATIGLPLLTSERQRADRLGVASIADGVNDADQRPALDLARARRAGPRPRPGPGFICRA